MRTAAQMFTVGDRVVVTADSSYFVRGAVGTVTYVDHGTMFRPVKVEFGDDRFDWLNPGEVRVLDRNPDETQ
ncbi:hypothetical protein EV383_4429 [Pseudonocardia sediminis]|uniref:DUF1918 domain-containing protein n=1 Tax=Pseudonocardia sediminis TaxID=1397368 RepID=A0A4Q7V202_PSEST|nr:hypothetical protein [Pseudonocardia sediminis]RZT87504.1 hypothetical protein EV383_4429 [Pseudonocardia sediminis]